MSFCPNLVLVLSILYSYFTLVVVSQRLYTMSLEFYPNGSPVYTSSVGTRTQIVEYSYSLEPVSKRPKSTVMAIQSFYMMTNVVDFDLQSSILDSRNFRTTLTVNNGCQLKFLQVGVLLSADTCTYL